MRHNAHHSRLPRQFGKSGAGSPNGFFRSNLKAISRGVPAGRLSHSSKTFRVTRRPQYWVLWIPRGLYGAYVQRGLTTAMRQAGLETV
jgi:hypothetical protein